MYLPEVLSVVMERMNVDWKRLASTPYLNLNLDDLMSRMIDHWFLAPGIWFHVD